MSSASEASRRAPAPGAVRARTRMRLELWAWTASILLCIISYPAVVIVRLSPIAGLVGGCAAGAFLLARAWFGYTGRRTLDRWPSAVLLCLAAAAAAGLTSMLADRSTPAIAAVSAVLVACEMMFTWYFLPTIVRDADTSEPSARHHFQLLPLAGRAGTLTRPALGMALLLGFLMLGVGALWHQGETWAPNPAGWFVATLLLTFGLMFVERMSFLRRSSREGNLVMPTGSFGRWLSAALLVLLIATLVGMIAPHRSAPRTGEARWTGSAVVQRLLGADSAGSHASASRPPAPQPAPAGGISGRRKLVLWLLLLLLLLLLAFMWGLSRTRAGRWLLAVAVAVLTRLANAWRRFVAALGRLLRPRRQQETPQPVAADYMPDPLFDIFDHPDLVSVLTPREVLIRTYHLMLSFGEMMGHGRQTGQTPFEYERELTAERPAVRDGLRALTWGYAGAMYSVDSAAVPDSDAVKLAWNQVVQAMKGEMTPEDFDLRQRAYIAARRLEQAARR